MRDDVDFLQRLWHNEEKLRRKNKTSLMNEQFTDIHHHLMYGIDDGAKNQKRMYEMLELAAADGITRILATSHMTPGVYEFDEAQYQKSLEEARAYIDQEDLNIQIDTGVEVLYTDFTASFLREGRIHTLAGTNRVLVEFSPDVRFERFKDALEQISYAGYVPVVAHVERYNCVTDNLKRALRTREELGAFYQMNCSTVLEAQGIFGNRFARKILKERGIDAIATDAHNVSSRRVHMREAYEAVRRTFSENYANHLVSGDILKD